MIGRLGLRAPLTAAAVAIAAVVSSPVPATAAPPPTTGCADVEMIVVRGTNEVGAISWGERGLVDLVQTKAAVTVSTYGVPYRASTDWDVSVSEGTKMLEDRLKASSDRCADQRFVLMGYSQGAWVVGDALAGRHGDAVPPELGSKVAAVVLYGDPGFTAGESFNAGTPQPGLSGTAARAAGSLNTYADRLVSYCYSDDYVCQHGAPGDDGTYGPGHGRYNDQNDAAWTFVEEHLPQPTPVGVRIIGPGSTCVDVNGDDNGRNGAAVQLWGCQSGSKDQRWTSTGGTLRSLGRCMDVVGNRTANGSAVHLWDCHGGGNQQWVQQTDGSLRNPQSGRCLAARGGLTSNATRLEIRDCNGSAAQHFQLS